MANGFRPIPVPDYGRMIGGAFRTYTDIRSQEENLAEAERKRKQLEQIQALSQKAIVDPKQLAQLAAFDPQKALAIQRFQQTRQQEMETEGASLAQSLEGRPLDDQVIILDNHIQNARQRGMDTSSALLLRTSLLGGPQQNQQAKVLISNLRQEGESRGLIKPMSSEKKTALAKNLALLRDPNLSAEEKAIVKANLYGLRYSVKINPDGSHSLTVGKGISEPSGLQKKTLGDVEKQLVNFKKNISNLKQIKKDYAPSYLTYLGKGKVFLSAVKEKAGFDLTPQQKKDLQGRKRFIQGIDQFFNAYRHSITGAQAAWKELERLKRSILNPDLSPSEFEASYDQILEKTLRIERLLNRIYREGLKGDLRNKKSPAARRLDELFMSNEDDSILERMGDLKNMGNMDEILQTLENEGYK